MREMRKLGYPPQKEAVTGTPIIMWQMEDDSGEFVGPHIAAMI